MKLEDLFKKCYNAKYNHVNEDGDYAIEKKGDTLFLLFQWSHSKTDWHHNFMFGAKPYSDMKIKWRCHRGFLRVWKSIKPYIESSVADMSIKRIYIVGYSHGAAIASLCHEYVWYNRPDLRENGLEGFGFGCPRVFFGWRMKASLKERWKHFHPVRNMCDIVTHLPPHLFGYRHVNKVLQLPKIGFKERHTIFKCVDSHYPENYIYSARNFDENQNK